MKTQLMGLTTVALLATVLVPAAPVAADGIDGDCRGVDLFGYYVGGSGPNTGVFRLACWAASAECVEDDAGEVCRIGAGVMSIVGAGFCHYPVGPLPPALAALCGGGLDSAGAILAYTGCTDRVPVGDQRIMPGAFVRLRQEDGGALVIGVTVDCGQKDIQCTFKLYPDGHTLQNCK